MEHNTFFAKLVKIINDMPMRLSNVFFILVLIAFPHGSFANAMVGGDFSEDYFKKFGIDKVFKCKELNRESIKKKL